MEDLIWQLGISKKLFQEEFQGSDGGNTGLQGIENKMFTEKGQKVSLSNSSNNIFVEEK